MLKHMRFPKLTYHRASNVLFVGIVIINVYIIAAPLWPQVTFWWQSHHTSRQAELTKAITTTPKSQSVAKAPAHKANGLIIPSILLDQPTLEGPERDWFKLLKQGIWRWPGSSTPDKGGNTVFLAHRFSYTGPHGAFYYLNKLKLGDKIGVTWNDKLYTYSVVSSTEVSPDDLAIEDNTADARITLFTCMPLWHPVNRLVVVAKLEKQS